MIQKRLADRLIGKIDSFPVLPTIASRIVEISSNPDTPLSELKRVIETDSTMVLEVLKMANSPFFGFRRKVTTLERAITLVGMSEIKNLVMAKSMFQVFRVSGDFNPSGLWLHSFYCGMAAKLLAPSFKLNPDELFIAGLIHDVGKLFIYMELDHESIRELEEARGLFVDVTQKEEKIVGIGHDQLAMRLLRKWMFPDVLTIAVGYHHHPGNAPDDFQDNAFPLVVHLADLLSHIAAETIHPEIKKKRMDHILAPSTCAMAKKLGFQLDLDSVIFFENQLKQLIKEESEIIGLLLNENEV